MVYITDNGKVSNTRARWRTDGRRKGAIALPQICLNKRGPTNIWAGQSQHDDIDLAVIVEVSDGHRRILEISRNRHMDRRLKSPIPVAEHHGEPKNLQENHILIPIAVEIRCQHLQNPAIRRNLRRMECQRGLRLGHSGQ